MTLSFTSKCDSDQLWCKPICNTTADVYAYWGSLCGIQVKRLMHLTERPPGWAWNSSDKWIWKCDIPSPNESAKLLLGALSENCLHPRSPEIKRLIIKRVGSISRLYRVVFIGPESDHWLCLSLTDSLTHWLTNSLTHSFLVNLIELTLACEDNYYCYWCWW